MTKKRRTYEPRVFRPRASSERPRGSHAGGAAGFDGEWVKRVQTAPERN
jgi:hypothetical protein